jgi:hypothetical protein
VTAEKQPPTGDTEERGGPSYERSFGKELDAGVDRSAAKRRIVNPGTIGPKLKQKMPRRTESEGDK